MITALTVAAIVLFICITGLINIQYRLLYYPSSFAPSTASLKAIHLKLWPSSSTDYRGLVPLDDAGYKKGTVIVFHGNGGTAADRTYYLDALTPLGYRVMLAEYPKYGGRRGELGEESFVSDAIETVRLAFEEYGSPLFILGESMGCGIAAAVAKKISIKIDGIILITPWDTLESVARSQFPFLPVRFLLKDQYDSISNLSAFKGKIAVVGAGTDAVIPIKHAKNLYDSLPGTTKRMWIFEGAGHNDWPGFADKAWWDGVMNFIGNNEKF